MKWFDYAAPRTLPEALELLSANPQARPFAGGTDLLVQLRAGVKEASLLVDVKHIPELSVLSFNATGGLTLGAAVPCARIYGDRAVRRFYAPLAEVASLIGGVPIQNRASVGGNLCNATPSADSIPLLIALGAICRIAGPSGEREMPVESFCLSPGRNALRRGELLVALSIPPPVRAAGARYLRFTPRNEMDIAVAGAAAWVAVEDGVFRSARIALSAVAPTPLFVPAAGQWLAGKPLNRESIEFAAGMAREAAKPITDMRGTADYRRHLCAVLTRRALEAAVERARRARS